MIIGNGMLAMGLMPFFTNRKDVIVFASGVSDSSNTEYSKFHRERELLESSIHKYSDASYFLYFGTCSVYDKESNKSPYVKHKLNMESIALNHNRGRVFRLPQVAGPNASPRTLLASLVYQIRTYQTISLWKNSTRNIIDINDIGKILVYLLFNFPSFPHIINIANPVSISVPYIISRLEIILRIKAVVSVIDKGSAYSIEIPELKSIINQIDVDFDKKYLDRVLIKYYK